MTLINKNIPLINIKHSININVRICHPINLMIIRFIGGEWIQMDVEMINALI